MPICHEIDNMDLKGYQYLQLINEIEISKYDLLIILYNLMKINFIRNLSDEVIKENQQLKTDIIVLKQQMANYEEHMMEILNAIYPQSLILSNPDETLRQFIKLVRLEKKQCQELKVQCQTYFKQSEQSHNKIRKLEAEITDRKKQVFILAKKWEQSITEFDAKECKARQQLNRVKKINQGLQNDVKELKTQNKIQCLLLEQQKRKQVEEVRQHLHNQLLSFRENSQQQLIRKERELKKEIAEKNKTIKDLEKTIQKLSNNIQLQESQSQVLKNLLQSFQQYNHLNKIIQDAHSQNINIKQENQDLNRRNLILQSKAKEFFTTESNYNSQVLRLSHLLQLKIQQIQKSERDKDAMELFFDQKWNSEYKKLKYQMERTNNQKIKTLEDDYKEKVKIMENKIEQSLKKIDVCQRKSRILEEIHEEDKGTIKVLKNEIKTLNAAILNHKKEIAETWIMSREQICAIAYQFSESKKTYNHKIYQLEELIRIENENSLDRLAAEKKKIDQITVVHQNQKASLAKMFQVEKLQIQKRFNKKIEHQQKEIDQIEVHESKMRKEMDKQLEMRIKIVSQDCERRIKLKQEQEVKKLQKMSLRYHELESKMAEMKKKNIDDHFYFEKYTSKLQGEMQKFSKIESQHSSEIKQFLLMKNSLQIRIGELQKREVKYLQNEQYQNNKMKQLLIKSQKENNQIQLMHQKRKQWVEEISLMEKNWRGQFQSVKKIAEKQINFYKSRIWELEEMYRRKAISKKDLEKIQKLNIQKDDLRNTINIQQAENIILNQVKDYYEFKLKQVQSKTSEADCKRTHLIFNRKIKKSSMQERKIFYNAQAQVKEVTDLKRYIFQTSKRCQNLSLSKTKFDEYTHNHKFNTTAY